MDVQTYLRSLVRNIKIHNSTKIQISLINLIIKISQDIRDKVEFGKNKHFKELIELLRQNDHELTQTTNKAILHFLNITEDEDSNTVDHPRLAELMSF